MIDRIPADEAAELYDTLRTVESAAQAVDRAVQAHQQAIGAHRYVEARIAKKHGISGSVQILEDGTVKTPESVKQEQADGE